MIIRAVWVLCSALFVASCLPEAATEITTSNTTSVIAGSKVSLNIAQHIQEIQNTERGLKRIGAKTNADGTYACDSGSFNYTLPDINQFHITFEDCETNNIALNGVITGSYTTGNFVDVGPTVSYSFTANGLSAEDNLGNGVTFETLDMLTLISGTFIEFSHNGIYHLDTMGFRGTVTANTVKINRHWFVNPQYPDTQLCTGEQSYTDEQGNVLSVIRNGNGIDIKLNGLWLKSYSCYWQ